MFWQHGSRLGSRSLTLDVLANTLVADRPLQVLEGSKVVERTGAVGKLRSVYCRDPDGNLVEYVTRLALL